MTKEMPPTPELDKMSAVREQSQAIGEFLDWLTGEKGLSLCRQQVSGNNGKPQIRWKAGVRKCKQYRASIRSREPDRNDLYNGDAELNPEHEHWPSGFFPANENIEKLLAEFFEIDLNKVEEERRAILEALRE
jgi:hypothetical protein